WLDWIPNLGGGNFGSANSIANIPGNDFHFYPADMDGDGDTDILKYNVYIYSTQLEWLINDGAGNFTPGAPIFTGNNNEYIDGGAVAVADFTGDNLPDIFARTKLNNADRWSIWINQNNAAFVRTDGTTALPGQKAPQAFHLDGDNLADWFVQTTSSVFWSQNIGGGAFSPLLRGFDVLQSLGDIAVADFDGNATPDLIYTAEDGIRPTGWYANTGLGAFDAVQELTENPALYIAVENADLDGDGDEDLVQASYTGISWRVNDGQGNFGPQIGITNLPLLHQIVDLDGDGDLDLAACDFVNFVQAFAYANDGNGNFTPGFNLPVTFVDYWSFFGDLDEDGDADIVIILENGDMQWYANDGAGNFAGQQSIGTDGDYSYTGILLKDMDADGDLDVLSSNASAVRWFENLGGGVFDNTAQVIDAAPKFYGYAVAADFDRDGDNDVFGASVNDVNSNAPGVFSFYENTGGGVFSTPYYFGDVADCRRSVIPHDLDGDGDLDIAWFSSYAIGWWENLNDVPYISGSCFWDKNENKIWDAGEPPITGIKLNLKPAGLLTYAAPNGEFRFFVPSGDYTLSYIPSSCWKLTTDSAEYHLTAVGTTLSGYQFGFKRSNSDRYVRPILTGGFPRCNTIVPFWISLFNRSCNESAGRVALVLDDLADFYSSEPMPEAISGDTLWWNFDTIQPFALGQISMLLKITGAGGDTIHLQAFTWLDEPNGSYTFSETTSYSTEIRCSLDPNDKLVDRPTVPLDYVAAEHELVYTIRFQNTGNDTAFLVRLRDTLSADLDWTTLRPLGSSHPYYTVLNTQTGLLQFTFKDIILPDSATNYAGSQGFVQFAIQLQPGLSPGTVVPNSAGIYFDANPVVPTNTAETRVLLPVATHSPVKPSSLLVQPNPTTGICTLRFAQPTKEGALLELMDSQGRVLRSLAVSTGILEQTLDLEDLPAGLYLIKWVQNGQTAATARIVRAPKQ
ncbi:MAG TPA: T9SS type A sorting domain-containing protein, partial [Saprospiraceae bacterium]|nr:T9SS type A sorting domain-containing protein [Saprospiraceae bacterium]